MKKMLNQFIKNFKKLDIYFDRKLQLIFVVIGLVLTVIIEHMPWNIKNTIIYCMCIIIAVGLPIFILSVYDGLIDDTKPNDDDPY